MACWSLKGRISLGVVCLLIAAILVLSIAAYWELYRVLIRDVDRQLERDLEIVLAVLNTENDLNQAQNEIKAFLNPHPHEMQTLVWIGELTSPESPLLNFVWSDAKPSSIFPPEQKISTEPYRWSTRHQEKTYRLIGSNMRRIDSDSTMNRSFDVIIGEPVGHVTDLMRPFLEVLLIVGLLVGVAVVILVMIVVRWGLQPVTRLTASMDQISAQHIQQPSPLPEEDSKELQPFVVAWNEMLKRLAVAVEQQRRFTADASHELRTPLAIVKSTLQCARTKKRSVAEYEHVIDRSLEDLARLEYLAEQLLVLARLDGVGVQGVHNAFSLDALVDDVCLMHQLIIEESRGQLVWKLCPAQILGDESQLFRVMVNLVENARKFGPQEGVITLTMLKNETHVTVMIHDEGGGIPCEQQKKIFERFYRLKQTKTIEKSGAGLGLALVKEIVEKHGGSVEVSSDLNHGTTFRVKLPLFLG